MLVCLVTVILRGGHGVPAVEQRAADPVERVERQGALSPDVEQVRTESEAVSESKVAPPQEEFREESWDESLAAYNEQAKELEAAIAAYRDAYPVFWDFHKLCEEAVFSLLMRGKEAQAMLKERGLPSLEPSPALRERISQHLAPLFVDVESGIRELIDAGQLSYEPDYKSNTFFELMAQYKNAADAAESLDPLNETPLGEDYQLQDAIGASAFLYAGMVEGILLNISPELEAQKEGLEIKRRVIQSMFPDQDKAALYSFSDPFAEALDSLAKEMKAAYRNR